MSAYGCLLVLPTLPLSFLLLPAGAVALGATPAGVASIRAAARVEPPVVGAPPSNVNSITAGVDCVGGNQTWSVCCVNPAMTIAHAKLRNVPIMTYSVAARWCQFLMSPNRRIDFVAMRNPIP